MSLSGHAIDLTGPVPLMPTFRVERCLTDMYLRGILRELLPVPGIDAEGERNVYGN